MVWLAHSFIWTMWAMYSSMNIKHSPAARSIQFVRKELFVDSAFLTSMMSLSYNILASKCFKNSFINSRTVKEASVSVLTWENSDFITSHRWYHTRSKCVTLMNQLSMIKVDKLLWNDLIFIIIDISTLPIRLIFFELREVKWNQQNKT